MSDTSNRIRNTFKYMETKETLTLEPCLKNLDLYLNASSDMFSTDMPLVPNNFVEQMFKIVQSAMPGNYIVEVMGDDEGKAKVLLHFFTEADKTFFILKYT